jgi:hypothetical protein
MAFASDEPARPVSAARAAGAGIPAAVTQTAHRDINIYHAPSTHNNGSRGEGW